MRIRQSGIWAVCVAFVLTVGICPAEAAGFAPGSTYQDGYAVPVSFLFSADYIVFQGDPLENGYVCFEFSGDTGNGAQFRSAGGQPRPNGYCTSVGSPSFNTARVNLFVSWGLGNHALTVVARAYATGNVVAQITFAANVLPPQPPNPDPDPELPESPGASPIRAPKRTDTTFLTAGLQTPCTFSSAGPLRFTVAIDRVVGDVTPDGTLVDATTLIANGIVSATTVLLIPAFDVDISGGLPSPALQELDEVWVNGTFVGYLTGSDGVWQDNRFSIATERVRFGKRNPGEDPTPGINEIEIRIDTANLEINGKSFYCTAVDWAAMTFDALAPIIMVHGNNSAGEFFGDLRSAAGDQLGFRFIEPFEQQKLPFDNSINMPTASIANHAALLGTEIPAKAAEFGARHAHLVAHSKGGLDVRAFLAATIPVNFGVLSLTTLSTPHHGSVGADYSIDAASANSLFSDNTTRTKLAQQLPPDAGTLDLRVSSVAEFNAVNMPLLPRSFTVDGVTRPIVYMSISADANLDSSVNVLSGRPTIQINETQGTSQGNKPDIVWSNLMTAVYRLMGEVASTRLEPRSVLGRSVWVVKETPTTSFQLNDFLVTVSSARLTEFRELTSTADNHATVANPANGQLTIDAIKRAQAIREP